VTISGRHVGHHTICLRQRSNAHALSYGQHDSESGESALCAWAEGVRRCSRPPIAWHAVRLAAAPPRRRAVELCNRAFTSGWSHRGRRYRGRPERAHPFNCLVVRRAAPDSTIGAPHRRRGWSRYTWYQMLRQTGDPLPAMRLSHSGPDRSGLVDTALTGGGRSPGPPGKRRQSSRS
jgi:hypothetical protein